jgi:GNAT superfamily N-acetyltransferase
LDRLFRITIRKAVPSDVSPLEALIDASVRGLQTEDYTPDQIEQALRSVYGVDSQLVADGTYFVAEASEASDQNCIAGCGGWSRRRTLFGGDRFSGRQDSLLNPNHEAAKIRAFFVHPNWVRRGIASLILKACEDAAVAAGFTRLEMGATLTGVPFYLTKGYSVAERVAVPLPGGTDLPIIRMEKKLTPV